MGRNVITGGVRIVGQVIQADSVSLGDGEVPLSRAEYEEVLRLLSHLAATGTPEAAAARDLADRLHGR
ncbi:hypothetical protein ABTZ03_06795 [Kitasatospora sp. NPDC096077]|uniref:hypothetical protein n=1 Tax=Kitasatospora sp. NPDC096077 TaxID=3155544 RepID=UPI00332EA89D